RRTPQSSSSWHLEFSVPGMQVFCAGVRSDAPQVHRVGDDGGIVIGTLFKRKRDLAWPEADPPLQFGPVESLAYAHSRGRWLIDHAWGDYVAFGSANGHKWV